MNFAEAALKESSFTETENGAIALNTTGNACLDLFGTIGSLRTADENRIETLFAEAYKENPLFATKIAFYSRDIRQGLGERRTFRIILRYLAKYHPEAIRPNLDLIGAFGRYDDLYCLVGTPVENDMWGSMRKQFKEDCINYREGKAISLLAKWIKTADASSKETRKLGILTAQKLSPDGSVYRFKRIIRELRKHIRVTESLMSTGQWDKIEYSKVPSRAMMIYRNAFRRHDEDRYKEFINRALEGKEEINSSTLFPYDLVEKILYTHENSDALEAQWRALPNYIEPGQNVMVMADVSGSMCGRPMATSIGLAIYFAEKNTGAYHNMFMTFSKNPQIVSLKGETLFQKIQNACRADWGMNTDLKEAFEKVLKIALENNIRQEDMPKSIVVISDMEIDCCGNRNWTFYEKMEHKFKKNGYVIPNIVFWNVNSRHNVFHADKNRKGVQICSGQSATVFKQLLASIGLTPVEMMEKVINSERYNCIRID